MAEISQVRDPNYEGFNYSALLDHAQDPLRTLAAGKLAIAQQQGQRMFDTQRDQNLSDLAGQREKDRLQTEANINEANRQRLRNESANQLFSNTAQRHPDWKPDPSKSLAENIASANGQGDQEIFDGAKAISENDQNQKAETDAILQKFGAIINPSDPRLTAMVNQQLTRDPSLTTGINPVLGPREIAMLNAGKTPQEVANTFTTVGGLMPGTQRTLLNAANTATAAIQQQLQERAAQRGQVEIAAVQNKYSFNNQLKQDMLSSIGRTRPDLLPRVAAMLGQSAPPPAVPAMDANGLYPPLSFGIGSGTAPASTPPAVATPGQVDDPILQHADFKSAQNTYVFAKQKENALQAQVSDLGQQIVNGDDLPADQRSDLSSRYEKAKTALATAQKTSADALQKGMNVYHSATAVPEFLHAVGYYPGGTNAPTLPPMPANGTPGPQYFFQPGSGTNAPTIVPGTPPGPQPTSNPFASPFAPMPSAPGASSPPSAMNGQQPSPFDHMAAKNRAFQIIGTSDQATLQRAQQYALTQLGMSQDQIHQILAAAINGDPNATARVKQIVAQSSQGATSAPSGGFDASQAFGDGGAANLPPEPIAAAGTDDADASVPPMPELAAA